MRKMMKIRIAISASAVFLLLTTLSQGQAVPTAETSITSVGGSPIIPKLDGVLHYALSGSEVVQFGYFGSGQVTASTALSGDVAYSSTSTTRPFSLTFAGGVILPNQQGQGVSSFWDVTASQGYIARHWIFNLSDSFNFLPQSPTTGLSGIAGVGDVGSIPVQGPVEGPAGGIFSLAGNRYVNSLTGSVERQIRHDTSISGSATWGVINFLDQNASTSGLNSTQISGTVAVNQRFDARSSGSIDAVYSTFTYSGTAIVNGLVQPDIESRGLNASYQRLMTKSLSASVSAGPQWVSSSNSTLIPSNLNFAASASLSYSRGLTNGAVNYSRGVNAGSGVLSGALSDSVYASLDHTYGRKWVASLTAGYSHSSGLTQLAAGTPVQVNVSVPVHVTYDTFFGAAQVRRGFGPHLSGYASYTVQDQSNNFPPGAQNALNGTSHTIGVGVTFTPRSTRLGQF
jgi:hypothetical protein